MPQPLPLLLEAGARTYACPRSLRLVRFEKWNALHATPTKAAALEENLWKTFF